VTAPDGSQHIYYGSYYGGIWHSRLDATGRKTVGDAVRVAVDNKFEGAYVTRRNGYWYLFASTANCCAGPTTGYSVHVGRSKSLTGPFLDKDGLSLNASGYSGGTPVLYQNGNRWIGTGHNTLATDDLGQDWILYHGIDRNVPYLNGTEGVNRRPMLIDRLDWRGGWPVVRSGCGPSDSPQLGPVLDRRRGASATGKAASKALNLLDCRRDLAPGRRVFQDPFNGPALAKGWTAVNDPAISFAGGALNWVTEKSDLVGNQGKPGILLRDVPRGAWTAETKLTIDLGKDEVRNFQQGGLVAYVNDKLFTRLSTVAIFNTRQTEFGKEMPWPNEQGYSYGGTIVGAPGPTTWLRITHRIDPRNGEHELTPFTSRDGRTWTRGGTWTLPAGSKIRVGLVSQGAGYSDAPPATSSFDYFRLYRP
jgi:arabinan endo-1,5-alpha-L-arabinosidase